MSNSLTERLAALTQEYLRQLADRVTELERAYSAYIASPRSRETAENLRLVAHKIAGSGATFGFDGITDSGRALERAINDALENDFALGEDTVTTIQLKYEGLKKVCIDTSREAEGIFEIAVESEEGSDDGPFESRLMALAYKADSPALGELRDQLRLFGYEVLDITSIDQFLEFAKSSTAGCAIVHTDFLFGCASGTETFRTVQRTLERKIHYIFVSERTDFHARISAIRAGGEAYFLLPLDITRLLDKVEVLSGTAIHEPYHVLIVDDDPEQVSYYALILQQAGMITSVASDPKTVLDVMVDSKPELILMDMYMPGCTGPELLRIIRQHEAFVNIPILFLSVEGDEEKQIQSIRDGGSGFITKPADPDYLIALVESHIARTRSIRYFMERDSLTGLLNHTNLRDQLIREILRSERTGSQLSFAMIDIDNFKTVNDTHGHLIGDRVLKSLSRILLERLRRTDIVGRYGGEEFGVVLINTGEADAVKIIDKIRANFEKVRQQGERGTFHVTFSCGIAGYPMFRDSETIGAAADAALYRAKNEGRNRVLSSEPST